MKAISLHQPWASAVAVGIKRYETRSWSTEYRGPLAIHAAKRISIDQKTKFRSLLYHSKIREAFESAMNPNELDLIFDGLPFGAIIARCNLVACVPVQDINPSETDLLLGDYSPGRFVWILQDIQRLTNAFLFNGRQGFFTVPDFLLSVPSVSASPSAISV